MTLIHRPLTKFFLVNNNGLSRFQCTTSILSTQCLNEEVDIHLKSIIGKAK